MDRHLQTKDLCINCLNAEKCTYYRNQSRPVIFCEEFACEDPAECSADIHRLEDVSRTPMESRNQSLCINCLNAGSCILKKPGEPVYYCEEYR